MVLKISFNPMDRDSHSWGEPETVSFDRLEEPIRTPEAQEASVSNLMRRLSLGRKSSSKATHKKRSLKKVVQRLNSSFFPLLSNKIVY